MAANIDTMFYAGKEKPWHGLGLQVASELTAAEALKKAGLDWKVLKFPIPHPITGKPSDRFYQIMREDNQEVFAAGKSADFTIFQNDEAFKLCDDILATKQAKFHTAGSLGRGERVWMLAKLPKDIRVNGTDDLTGAYLLITNAHDGKKSLQIMVTYIRVVCQNTLFRAMKGARDIYSVIHYGDMHARVEDVRSVLKMSSESFKDMHQRANLLASKVLNRAQLEGILAALIPLRNGEDGEEIAFRKRHHDNILALHEDNDGGAFPKIAGTAWCFVNSVVRYADYHKSPFGFPDKIAPIEKRATSILYGADAELKRMAMDLTMEAVK